MQEVTPEFGAHLNIPGIAKDKRVDYAILKDGKPIILIEAKHHKDKLILGYDQLFAYAITTCCRIGILTNGLIWRFYADLAHPGTGKLDPTPFLELDLQDLKEALLEELCPLTKSALNIDGMLAAEELNGVGGILQILNQEFDNPGDDFIKFFYQRLSEGKPFVGNSKILFTGYAKRAFGQFVRARVNRMLDESLGNNDQIPLIDLPIPISPEIGSSIVTTEEEMEGFYLVKSILRDVVSSERITYKDVVSYFGIFLDGNSHKPICRLYFNNSSNKRLGILIRGEDDKQESKHPIDRLDHIYQYAEPLKCAASQYLAQPTEETVVAAAL